MTSRKSQGNGSNASSEAAASFRTAPDKTIRLDGEAHTPEQKSPRKMAAGGITQAQKQALIDNLQLEITERARKLRAQYAMQAQHLRERLEMRINRIPSSLRNRKMQDLLDEQAERANPKPAPPLPVTTQQNAKAESPRRGVKRQSDQISTTHQEDQENESQDLNNPKKRVKTAATTAPPTAASTNNTANTKATRTAAPQQVLSPKSHNASNLPRSPVRPTMATSEKQQISRLPSPHKPLPAPPAAASKGAVAKKPSKAQLNKATAQEDAGKAAGGRSSDASEASNTSAGTTVVKKGNAAGAAAAKGKLVPPKKTTVAGAAAGKAATVGKKTAIAAKKENVPPATRSLRKRN